jgi:hypothetical protein
MDVTRTPVLVGRDQHRSRQFSLLAGAIFLACFVGYTALLIVGRLPVFLIGVASIGIVFGVAVVHAYLNDGLLVTTLMTVAVGVAGVLALQIAASIYSFIELTPSESLGITLEFAALGLGAFVIGTGTRRVVTYIRVKSATLVTKR